MQLGSVNKSEIWAYMVQLYLFKKDGSRLESNLTPIWVPLDDLKTVESLKGCRSF